MGTASPAEDLKRYLIVPPSPSSTNSNPSLAADGSGFTTLSSAAAAGSSLASPPPNGPDILQKRLHQQNSLTNKTPEMDTATPSPLPDIHTVNDPTQHGVFKLEDYLAPYQALHAASLLARESDSKSSGAKQTASATTTATAGTTNPPHPLSPIAVGARTSKHTILLHEKYQALALPQPEFTYHCSEATNRGWSAEVGFPGLDVDELQGIKVEGAFGSKQEAKEAVSRVALEVLERMVGEGRVGRGEKAKRKSGVVGVGGDGGEKGTGPNYVGLLLEFQRATASPQPTYTDYQSGTRFACLASIEGHPTPFGSLTSLHGSKKAARQDAASHVVAHFKALGVWPSDATLVGGIKKKKSNTHSTEQPTPIMGTTSPGNISSKPAGESKPSDTASSDNITTKESFASRVAQLATLLSLSTPEYTYVPHPTDPTFHSVSCSFRNGGPHAGPIGEVRNVLGRKKAKEECARLVLAYLEEVRERRLEYGREMMRGVGGGAIVGEVAVGRGVEGEAVGLGGGNAGAGAGGAGADKVGQGNDAADEDEKEVFEDAME